MKIKIKTRLGVLLPLLLCTQTPIFSQMGHASEPRAERSNDPYNAYRWDGKTADWYEWWYYKVVLPETKKAYYFVYGVVNPMDVTGARSASRSYVDFGDFEKKFILEEKRSVSDFTASRKFTDVRVAGLGEASDRHLQGRLMSDGASAAWDLSLAPDWKFNAMGWGMHFNFLSNIYWYPAQASAVMNGWIETLKDGIAERVEVKNAPAYQDRNWGRSFPKWWTWLVSNHFPASPGTVLAAGGGRPKVFNRSELIDGLVIGLRHKGREYAFRPTDGDRVRMNVDFGRWEVNAENGNGEKIVISAYAPQDQFIDIPFITPNGQTFHDYEALLGHMSVKLYRNVGWFLEKWELIADLDTDAAGIEYGSFRDFGRDFGVMSANGASVSNESRDSLEPRLDPITVFNERQVVFESR